MKSISIIAALLMAGCCQPQIIKEPIEVRVPVAVPCIDAAPDKPNWVMDNPVVAKGNLFDKGKAALREIEQRREYERTLEAIIVGCTSRGTHG